MSMLNVPLVNRQGCIVAGIGDLPCTIDWETGQTVCSGSSSSSSSATTDIASITSALANAANAATQAYKNTQSPSLISGTNLVYNPATGGILGASPTGVAASQISSSLLPVVVAVAAVAFVMIMAKK